MQDLDHKHMLVTAHFVSPPQDINKLKKWIADLVEAVDMKILVQPNLIYCDTVGNEGITGTTVIETSHCAFHIWDNGNPPVMQFDLYSCKRFDPNIVANLFSELNAVNIAWTLIDRNDKHFISSTGAKQFIPFVDLLDEHAKMVYISSRHIEASKRTVEQKEAHKKYNSILHKYSFKAISNRQKHKDSFKATLADLKSKCKRKNMAFNLTAEWLQGALAEARAKWPNITTDGDDTDSFWYANVDRIDPTKGYTQDNCRYIPRCLNVAKWKWSASEIETLKDMIKDL